MSKMFEIQQTGERRRAAYLFHQQDNATFVYISADLNFPLKLVFPKLFIGDGAHMRQLPFEYEDVEYYTGEGFSIKTAEGYFYRPGFYERMSTRWQGKPLKLLLPWEYDIVETPEGEVTITKSE